MHTLISFKVFARKLVRINNLIKNDVEAEARCMMELLGSCESAHSNITIIFRHGQLGLTNMYYFMDMELGHFTLGTYITSIFNSTDVTIDWASMQNCGPVLARPDSLPLEKLQNIWTIAVHIASGLEFMHARKYVHRDLKPANGNQTVAYPDD
jgi:serine/threonine protein kinase